MLSPATFIGIANAAANPAPAASTANSPQLAPARPAEVQQARILTTPTVAAPIAPPLPRGAATASPALPATPPRNLPRGSLLDLSV
jgi:hypothetical protein